MPISDPPSADLIPAAQAGPRIAQDGGVRRLMQDLMIMTNSFSFVLADTDPAEVDVERHRDDIADIISSVGGTSPISWTGFWSRAHDGWKAAADTDAIFDKLEMVSVRAAVAIHRGTVLTMDQRIGTHTNTDVLVEDGLISAVAPGLPSDDAEVVDVSRHIIAPGMIDTHRHTWQTQLRALCADWTRTVAGRPPQVAALPRCARIGR
jgi:hypothetical protein